MRLNVKNFENDTRKIIWEQNGMFLNVFYFKKVKGFVQLDKLFFKALSPQDNKRAELIKLFRKVENYYGIELLRPEFKIEQTQLN